jgi:nucleoside-diphosphate-sugar epimerase
MSVAITGASGFIGASAAAALTGHGLDVVRLGRRAGDRPFRLGPAPDPEVFSGVDTLLHCAYDFTPTAATNIYRQNVLGTANLFRAATRAGVGRIVFISSMSAYSGTRQLYGRAKLEGEELVRELGGVALRLGLVWGEDAGGMAGAVAKLAGLPVVPVLGSRSHQFTVHRDDVVTAIRLAVQRPEVTGVIGVADPDPVPTGRLLTGLAGGRAGRLLPIPWRPVYLAMRAAEAARIPLPLRADSVLGLVRPAPSVPRADALGIDYRPFPR